MGSNHANSAGGGNKGAAGGTSGAADRAGNNGTVKIDNAPFDSHPNNEPHVTCAFQVDFYNYGSGDYWAKVGFAQHPPTPSDRTTTTKAFIGEDPPGGGTDVDAEETYQPDLAGSPHPKQGYHVKLTINAPHSQGADTKHKVFWVKPCSSEEQPPGGGESPPGETPPGGGGGETPPGQVPPGGGGGETPPGQVPPGGGGGETPRGQVPPAGSGQPPAPGVPGNNTTPIPAVPGNGSGLPVTTPIGSATSGQQSSSAATSESSAAAAGSGSSRTQAAPVPTAVEAGLAGGAQPDPSGSLATSLLGLSGLLTAGWLAAFRRRGARQH